MSCQLSTPPTSPTENEPVVKQYRKAFKRSRTIDIVDGNQEDRSRPDSVISMEMDASNLKRTYSGERRGQFGARRVQSQGNSPLTQRRGDRSTQDRMRARSKMRGIHARRSSSVPLPCRKDSMKNNCSEPGRVLISYSTYRLTYHIISVLIYQLHV